MAQGIFGGATSYEEQSLADILEDITKWIKKTETIKNNMISWLEESEKNGFWSKVGDDFQITVYSSISYFNTIISDLKIVKKAIDNHCITQKEIVLLRQIGSKAFEYNNEYPKSFKCEKRWHDYGNPDYEIIKNMYGKGRDYFISLQDARNAAKRLEDYMDSGQITNNTMSFSGNISHSQIQQGTVNSNQTVTIAKQTNNEEALMVLEKIKEYSTHTLFSDELGDKADEVKMLLEEAIKNINNEKNSSILKNSLTAIMKITKEAAKAAGTAFITSGIIKLIEQFLKNCNFIS